MGSASSSSSPGSNSAASPAAPASDGAFADLAAATAEWMGRPQFWEEVTALVILATLGALSLHVLTGGRILGRRSRDKRGARKRDATTLQDLDEVTEGDDVATGASTAPRDPFAWPSPPPGAATPQAERSAAEARDADVGRPPAPLFTPAETKADNTPGGNLLQTAAAANTSAPTSDAPTPMSEELRLRMERLANSIAEASAPVPAPQSGAATYRPASVTGAASSRALVPRPGPPTRTLSRNALRIHSARQGGPRPGLGPRADTYSDVLSHKSFQSTHVVRETLRRRPLDPYNDIVLRNSMLGSPETKKPLAPSNTLPSGRKVLGARSQTLATIT